MSYVNHLECSMTADRFEPGEVRGLSPAGRPLLVRYDTERIRTQVDRDAFAAREPGFWRYRELLPLDAPERAPRLGEVATPLVPMGALQGSNVQFKDESRLPTGSFKARGLGMAVARAAELGIRRLAMPSNGNAGAALAAYAARAGLQATVVCPADTPPINVAETRMQGAHTELLDGRIDDCGRRVAELVEHEGWFDVSTLKEPYRLEGKKTMGIELAEQLGWRLPDVIFYPTGGGTGLIGMWKAFAELRELGWLACDHLPRMVAVQASGCAPMVRAFEAGERHAERWTDSQTLAAGIRVPAAVGDFLILDAVRESGGTAVAVDDDAIVAAWRAVVREEGVLLCPESAAAYAAYEQLLESGWLAGDEHAVVFNCATGLKYQLPVAGG